MIIDVYLNERHLAELKKKLLTKIPDEELYKVTLKEDSATSEYIKKTLTIDAIVSLLEGRAIYHEGKSIEDFSKDITATFNEVYPFRKKETQLLKSV